MVWGAGSLVGRTILSRLVDAGYDVVAISRRPHISSNPRLRWTQVDLDDPNALDLMPDCDAVISLAPIWMTATLCEALADRPVPPKRVIAFSSTSALTKAESASSTERELARNLTAGEVALSQLAPRITSTILRPTMIYTGNGDRNVEKIARHLLRFRVFPLIGHGDGLRQPVHSDDLAAAAIQALSTPATECKIYNLAGSEVLTFRQLVDRVGQVNGVKVVFIRVPLMLARLALKMASVAPRIRTIPRESLARMSKNMTFDYSTAAADMLYNPRSFEPSALSASDSVRSE